MDINEQIALIPGHVDVHTASVCPRGGIDLTITVPDEIGRKPLGALQSPEGMHAIARTIAAAADRLSSPRVDAEPPVITQQERDQWRKLRASATAGNWVAIEHLQAEMAVAIEGFERTRRIADLRTDPADYGRSNALYIAAAANALPKVLDYLEAVETERDQLAAALRKSVPADPAEQDAEAPGRADEV